jgi:uncharacterized protein with von Willebrand factor type A (vWA) domain
MSPSKRVEQELNNFILFGSMMTPKLRHFVAEIFFYFLYDPDYPALDKLRASSIPESYPNWYKVLRQLLSRQELREIGRHNEDLAFSLARETLSWAKKTFLQFESSHLHREEEQEWSTFKQGAEVGDEDWQDLLLRLKQLYPEHRQNWEFYHKTYDEQTKARAAATDNRASRLQREEGVLRSNILRDWEQYIQQGKTAQESAFLDQSFNRYFDSLGRKVEKLRDLGDLLSPFYNFLGLAWNDSLQNWDKLDWDQLTKFADSLRRDRTLRELAELLGKWRRAQEHQEMVRMQRLINRPDWQPNPYGKSEIIGIHQSGDLTNMLPGEVALLSSPEMEILLSLKYVEKKLLTFQYRSQDLSSTQEQQEEEIEDPQPDTAGPFILNIDTSGSMFGAPERIAKALSLAILEIALKQKRQVFLISFSTGFQSVEMTGMEKDLGRFIDFLKMSFHGGTDIQPALEESLNVLERHEYQDADVLIISDFVVPRLSRETFERVEALRQEKQTSFHSMFITRRADSRQTPLPIFDQHWVYDLDQPGVMRQAVDQLRIITDDQ